ncbi:MAG: hypothetical protein KAX50_03400 [Saprospiraceae bacterium]|nr:hypothetical protein [Saprospiraceae bacterium]
MKIKTVISILMICSLWSCKLDNGSTAIQENEAEAVRSTKPPGKYCTDFENEECKRQMDSAKIDVRNGKLLYEDNSGGWTIIRYDDEMEEILNAYGIEYMETGPNCTLEQECYGYYMDSIISQRFGKEFIQQIEQRADSLFLSRWRTKIYESWEIDTPPIYNEGDTETYIEQSIKFPEKWDTVPMEFERQFITLNVFVNNQGELTRWEFHEFYNLKESNEKFLPKIQSQVNQIMAGMVAWKPGKLMDRDVNSTIWLDIDLDKER